MAAQALLTVILAGCGAPGAECADGFERWPDGNCYPGIFEGTGLAPDLPTKPEPPPQTVDTAAPSAFYEGPIYIEYGTSRCTADDAGLILKARTRGWALRASIAVFGTGLAVPIDEEHDLFPIEQDPNGLWDSLEVGPLTDQTAEAQALRNLNTRFDCLDEEADLLTFVVRVHDLEGALLDCAIWGHDEALVQAGGATYVHTTPPTDFSGCFDLDGPD